MPKPLSEPASLFVFISPVFIISIPSSNDAPVSLSTPLIIASPRINPETENSIITLMIEGIGL